MTSATDYTAATRNAKDLLTSTLDSWKDGVSSVTEQFRALPSAGSLPQLDVTDAVERQFSFIKQLVDLNHQYARQLAEVATTFSDVTRQQIESVGGAVRDQLQSVSDVARNGVDTVEKAAREQAEQVAAQAQGVAVAGVEHHDGLGPGVAHRTRDDQPGDGRAPGVVVGHQEPRGEVAQGLDLPAHRGEVGAVRDVELDGEVEGHETSVSVPASTS